MTSEPVARVRYFPGQFLRTPDFTAEQAYHLAMRRRHNIAHHTFGIVSGLEVTLLDGLPVVEPGMAVDGYGRELVLAERTRLDAPGAFVARATDRLDVSLAYQFAPAGPAPEGYVSCTTEDTSYRVIEQPVLRYSLPDPAHPDRRRPATVPEADQHFAPFRAAPDDPVDDWPVFLATVLRNPDGTFTVDPDGRPYAGLVGECIRAPSGRTAVQIGVTHADDPFRFAVRAPGLTHSGVPRLAVLRDGTVVVAGTTTVLGTIEAGRVTLPEPATTDDVAKAAAKPWTLARVADSKGHDQLRLTMEDKKGREVVIGVTRTPPAGGAPQFDARLTVRSDGSVVVHGDLVVEGSVTEKARRPVPLSPEAEALIGATFLSGVGGASVVADRFLVPPAAVVPGPSIDEALVAAAEAVAGDLQQLGVFTAALQAVGPDAVERLRTALGPGS